MESLTSATRSERLHAFHRSPNIPPSFYTNTTTEEKVLDVAKQFETLYHKFFPDRKPLFLYPSNECQKKKMICSYVRPTSLIYDELFDLKGCCQFVADYVRYEPLHKAVVYDDELDDTVEQLPQQIVSPATALDWQVGNCFEMSLILTSVLIGAGFNAYVVVGTASKAVCLSDQRNSLWEGELPNEVNSDDEVEDNVPQNNPYVALIPQKLELRLTTDPDPVPASAQGSEEVSVGDMVKPTDTSGSPTNVVKPIHSWVLLLPGGRRSVAEAVFVEPSTAQQFPLSVIDGAYTSVESIFNHQDYLVNMRPEAPVSTLSPNIADGSQWESVFSFANPSDEEDETLAGTLATARRTFANDLSLTTAGATMGVAESTETSRGRRTCIPNLWSNELTLSRQQFENRYPAGYKEVRYINATVRHYAPYSQSDFRVLEVAMPDVEFAPLEERHIFYAHRADKLRRSSLFPLPIQHMSPRLGSSILMSVSASSPASFASNASNGLRKIVEWYDKGRMRDTAVEGLREMNYEPGKQRTMKFYGRARSDGLYCRMELLYDAGSLRKVKEFYKGRSDRLWYRSYSYSRPSTMRDTHAHNLIVHGPGIRSVMRDYPRIDPIRISQKFRRNESVPAGSDVAKTTFLRPMGEGKASSAPVGEMWVFFHYEAGSILRPYHMFAKPSSSVEEYIAASAARKAVEPPVRVVSLPGEEPPSELELYNERKWLNAVEATCLMEQRAKVDECIDILKSIRQDHTKAQSVLSTYDTLRNRPKETEAERARKMAEAARREESRKDYLAPYIAKLEMPADFDGNYLAVRLSVEQAKQVRDEALQELKERLIQRGHIMQSRMDKEKEEFNRRQQLYRKNCDASALEGDKDTEAFALYCKEATWKMKVLDDRLSQHIEHASDKYSQLAQRLADDPRLAALYHPSR